MYENILVPYDGSDEGEKGARHAVELAASVGATVHALYVIDLPGAPRTVYIRDDEDELREEYRNYGEEVTGEVADWAVEEGVDTVKAIRSGGVAEEINDYAEDNDVDLIVMGSAFRGTLGSYLGGKTEAVVRASTIPVTTVRKGRDE